jgi:adenosine kinase
VVVGTVGEDFGEYRQWLDSRGVDTSAIKVIPGEHTASCFINTDLQDNQITAFYPGAMAQAATLSLPEVGATAADLVIIAPNDPKAISRYAAECTEAGIPYLYDPSMQLPRMDRAELEQGCKGAKVLAGNDYEFGMMADKMGLAEPELRRRTPITVMTRGEAGALITVDGQEYEIPPAKPLKVVDPTGAGDAFRAGFVMGMSKGLPWPVVGRIASLTAVYAIEHPGTQEHSYTFEEFISRYVDNFGPSHELAALRADRPRTN